MPPARLTLQALRQDGRLDALAEAFATREDADELLDEVGYPRGRRPAFNQPLFFWRAVCQEVQNGLTRGGLEALLSAATALRAGHAALGREPVKVLFLAATPAGADQVQHGREWEAIKAVADAPRPSPIRAVSQFGIDDQKLLSVLTAVQPAVLHFSGHGLERGHLVLQDDRDNPVYLSLAEVARAIRAVCQASPIRLVVLNACYAADAADALWPEVEAVVGSEKALRDQLAVVFAQRFYETLTADRQSLGSAVEAGRLSMRWHLAANPHLEERMRTVVPRPRSPQAAASPADWVGEQVVLRTRPGINPTEWYLGHR